MTYRIDICNDELFKNYEIQSYIADNGRYRVDVCTLGYKSPIGSVELVLGRWKIIGDHSEEIRDLIEAIRKTVLIYLKCQNEFDELKMKFEEAKVQKV